MSEFEQLGLGERFRRLIRNTGPISLAHYMAESNAAYYGGKDPLGGAGDFITAPEISQMFGELIGLWLADMWINAGRDEPVHYVELGPGRGTQCGHHGPVPGQQTPFGRQGGIKVGGHPGCAGPDSQSRLGQIGPGDRRGEPLDDRHRTVAEQPDRFQPDGPDLGGQCLGADDEDLRAARKPLGQ